MPLHDHELPGEIRADIGTLLDHLAAAGFRPVGSRYEPASFGDYLVDFRGPTGSLRITRDRGQYMLEGDRGELESAGLWRAFDDRDEFTQRLTDWATHRGRKA